MPRKKKKSILEKKPSLLFIESPVHIERNVPSPVLCARHPPTANIVQVEDLEHLSWVSPQFRNSAASTSEFGKRHTRRRRHSIASHRLKVPLASGIKTCNKENSLHNQTVNRLRKYRSLKFLGDRTAVQSVIEDVEVSIDDNNSTASENDAPKSKLDDISNDSPEINWAAKRRLNRCRTKSSTISDKVSTAYIEPVFRTTEYGVSSQEQLQSRAPVKRLFSDDIPASSSVSIPSTAASNNAELEYTETADVRLDVMDLDALVSETSEEETKSPSVRGSERLLFLKSQNISSQAHTILAPDTPEAEYGWSIRKRQLIKYLKKKS